MASGQQNQMARDAVALTAQPVWGEGCDAEERQTDWMAVDG
jgi:hypothetical protein